MKEVQNAKVQKKARDELYRRYEHRGTTYDKSPEYAEQKSREISARAYAPKSYKISGGAADLKKYKNGVSLARRYMTDEDFADYYKSTREYSSPQANVEIDTPILLQRVDVNKHKKNNMKSEKNDIRKKLKLEADRNNPKNLYTKKNTIGNSASSVKQDSSSKFNQVLKEAAKTWVPVEERHEENIVDGTKTKIPFRLILAILAITISLFMIVGSAVLLSSAQRERNELNEEIKALDFQINELKTELNKKNEKIDIEFFAEEVLGMINQEHVKAEYINSNKTDGVEEREGNKASLASLINWILQNLR